MQTQQKLNFSQKLKEISAQNSRILAKLNFSEIPFPYYGAKTAKKKAWTRLSFEIGINFFLKNGTYIYLKRLTCMNEDVLLHVGELGEGFATNFTLKMFHHIVWQRSGNVRQNRNALSPCEAFLQCEPLDALWGWRAGWGPCCNIDIGTRFGHWLWATWRATTCSLVSPCCFFLHCCWLKCLAYVVGHQGRHSKIR